MNNDVFDEYDNYKFPTDIGLDTPNNATSNPMNTLDELWQNIEKWKKEVEEQENELRIRNRQTEKGSSKPQQHGIANGKEQHKGSVKDR